MKKDLRFTEEKPTIHIQLQAQPGVALHDCQREAAMLCLEDMQTVSLTHNGREYIYRPSAIIDLLPDGE